MKTYLVALSLSVFCLALGMYLGSEITKPLAAITTEQPSFVKLEVDATAYSPSKHITQGDPFQTASGKRVSPHGLEQMRYVALSRDLLKKYNIKWGDIVYIGFEVQDTMAAKVTNTVDLFLRNLELARKFGRQKRMLLIEKK